MTNVSFFIYHKKTNDMADLLIPLLIFLAITIVLFLILREINMWYWKINERISIQNQTNFLLEKILSQLKSTDETYEVKQTNAQTQANAQSVDREILNNEILKIVSVNNETLGAKVYINGQPAKDGSYIYKSLTHKLVVKDGQVIERFYLEKIDNYIFEKKTMSEPTVGDKVYTSDWVLVANGKCKYSLFKSYIVKNGEIVK